jgi:hypothetical protein
MQILAFAVILSFVQLLSSQSVSAEELITGSATYDVSLSSSGGAMALSEVGGQMVEKITRDCDTYRMEVDLVADLVAPAGPPIQLTLRSRTVESPDALEFDHSSRLASTEVDGSAGTATRRGGVLSVTLTRPSEKTVEFDGDLLFPIGLLKSALAAAKQGETFVSFKTFKASGGGDEAWNVTIVISPAGDAESGSTTASPRSSASATSSAGG